MKLTKIMVVLLLCFPILQSCLFQEKDIFDKPADQRLEEAAATLKEALASSDKGWRLTYYTDTAQFGAYNFLLKFDGENVTVQGDSLFPQGVYTSKFGVNKSQGGIVLDFSSYNDVLTDVADPGKYVTGSGLSGDKEFVWKRYSADKDTIFFQAKKNLSKISLIKFDGDWNSYMDDVNNVMDKFSNGGMNKYFKLLNFDDGTTLILGSYHKITRRFDAIFINEHDSLSVISNGIAFNDKGLEFIHPVTIKGKTVKGLDFDKATGIFSAGNAALSAGVPNFVMPGDFSRLFQAGETYLFSHLNQDLYLQYWKIDSILTSRNIEFYRMAFVAPSGSLSYNVEVQYIVETEEGDRYSDVAAKYPVKITGNLNSRGDSFRFEKRSGLGAFPSGTYLDLIRPELDAFLTVLTETGKDYIAIPDEYFEYIRFGSIHNNTFFGIKKN
ncbi:MAG: DUF4302 domain-containing protein [Prevotellaceae bacterium]|jgi:hypothetical protein|nr:DUF4302 domain-containing protein [Prevotellaceae bacterium]